MSPSVDPVARNVAIITSTLTACMVFESIRFFSDEIRLIWPRFWKTTEAKIYILTRYPGLVGQSFNTWFAFKMLSGVPNNPFVCRLWSSYQAAMTQYMLLSVQLLLMMQVYKMYNKGKSIFALLFIFGGAQSTAMAVNARLIVTGTRHSPTCVTISPHHNQIYVAVSIIMSFVFILVAMLWRFFGNRPGWSDVPQAWLKLAVRDSSCTTIAITLILIFMSLCTTRVIDTQMNGNIIFYVLLSCLWFAVECKILSGHPLPHSLFQAGRIVLHQERFRAIQESQKGDVNDPSRWTQTIEVDLDDIIAFDDPDTCPTSPSSLEVESTKVGTPVDSISDTETKDIADEGEDNVPLSSCAPTFMFIGRCISGEGLGPEK